MWFLQCVPQPFKYRAYTRTCTHMRRHKQCTHTHTLTHLYRQTRTTTEQLLNLLAGHATVIVDRFEWGSISKSQQDKTIGDANAVSCAGRKKIQRVTSLSESNIVCGGRERERERERVCVWVVMHTRINNSFGCLEQVAVSSSSGENPRISLSELDRMFWGVLDVRNIC